MSPTTRNRVILSLVLMFCDEHELDSAPAWLLELHTTSDNNTLLARLANWRLNYPQHFANHGLYVM